jgi:hypothetical protein
MPIYIHIHTLYSYDGTTSIPAVLGRSTYAFSDVFGSTNGNR